MAKNSVRKDRENRKILNRHFLITGAIMIIYVVFRMILNWDSFTFFPICGFAMLCFGYLICFKLILSYISPLYDDDGKIEDVNDLSKVTGSIMEYVFDIMYVQWFIQIGTLFWSKFWFLYLVIPVFAIYKLWGYIKPLLSGGGLGGMIPGMPNLTPEQMEELERKEMKKQAKAERKEKRMVRMK